MIQPAESTVFNDKFRTINYIVQTTHVIIAVYKKILNKPILDEK